MTTTTTTEQIVVKSSMGRIVQQFDKAEDAVEWAKQRKEQFGDRAPTVAIVRVTTIKEEQEIAHV